MKQFIILATLLLLPTLTISAMEDFSVADSIRNEQDRKRINDIKLKENALYAEIREAIYIGDEGEDEDMAKVKALTKAQQKSIDLLQTHVIEIFAKRLKMSKQDVQEIWDVIDDKCQNIEVKRGDLFRVFSYIMKDTLRIGLKGKLSPEEIETVLGKQDENLPANPIPENLPQPDEQNQEVLQSAFTETPVAKPEEPKMEPKVEEKTEPVKEIEVPALCRTMLEKGDMTNLLTFLDGEKTFQKLIYGSQKNMKSPEKCYIVILDKESRKIVTVLGLGQVERTNYVTKQPDNYNNYRGSGEYMAVFVQEL